jgi:hypothetical protein
MLLCSDKNEVGDDGGISPDCDEDENEGYDEHA